jgi:hypothetical protein
VQFFRLALFFSLIFFSIFRAMASPGGTDRPEEGVAGLEEDVAGPEEDVAGPQQKKK